ncbi:MAG TPA: hypothetical protein VJN89_04970 [Candidatus Acidoferrum sp.]|nr:hypothetical protein [Candidatus Acidoferrum sp.]
MARLTRRYKKRRDGEINSPLQKELAGSPSWLRASGEDGAELAGGEALEGAKALGEFDGGQAVLAVEPAKEVWGGTLALPGVAIETAGDEVAVGVALTLRLRHDVIEGPPSSADPAQTVKAGAEFASVDGLAQGRSFEEIDLLEAGAARETREAAVPRLAQTDGANLFGQTHMDDVARFAAFQQLHRAFGNEAAQGLAHTIMAKAKIAGQPVHGKTKAGLPFQAGVPEKVGIDGALHFTETQARGQEVLELLPDKFGVGLFGFHWFFFP